MALKKSTTTMRLSPGGAGICEVLSTNFLKGSQHLIPKSTCHTLSNLIYVSCSSTLMQTACASSMFHHRFFLHKLSSRARLKGLPCQMPTTGLVHGFEGPHRKNQKHGIIMKYVIISNIIYNVLTFQLTGQFLPASKWICVIRV